MRREEERAIPDETEGQTARESLPSVPEGEAPPSPPPDPDPVPPDPVPSDLVPSAPFPSATSSPEGEESQMSSTERDSDLPERGNESSSRYWDEPLPDKRRRNPNPKYIQLADRRFQLRSLDNCVLMGLDWTRNHLHNAASNFSKMMAAFQLVTDPFTGEIDGELHLCLLASKASQADKPTYEEALNGPHREGFLHAMHLEMITLNDMGCWHAVDKTPGMNVLPSTWAFKLKRYRDGSV